MFCGFPQSVFFFLYWTMEFGNNFKDMPAQTEEGWIWMNFYLLTCRQGVILDQAYGGPSSVPGKAALLTGRYSSRLFLLSQPKTYLFCHFFPRSTAFFICCHSNSIIFYRTGLPLVSPAILEPMGLPTDFKLLPKVNRPVCSNLSKDWNDINWWDLLRFCLLSLFISSVCQYLEEVGYVSHALGSWGLGFCHPDYLPTK